MPVTGISTQLAALLFLATLFLSGVLLLGALLAHGNRRPVWRRRLLLGAGGIAAVYALALLGGGLLSRPITLPPGAEKYFCELDCHLAYRVTGLHSLSRADTAGQPLWAVTLQARFDPATMGPRRSPTAPVWPGPRQAQLMDAAGRMHDLVAAGSDTAGLMHSLRPGERRSATLLFAVPAGVVPTALALTDGLFVDRLLIGHERSPFHALVLLPLPAPA